MAVTRALRVAVAGLLPLPPPPPPAQRRPARGARTPWPTLAHLQRLPNRNVAARAKKLTGVGTDQLKHEGSGGGTISHGSGNGGGNGGGGGGGGGGSNSGDDDHDDPRRALALDTIKWLAIAAAVAATLVAALPYALSHPLGLSATLALANLALPDDVSVQVDRVDASWHSPLALHGLRLVERSGGGGGGSGSSRQGESPNSAPFDPSSSDEEEEEEEEEEEVREARQPLPQMAAGTRAAGGSGAGMLRRRRRGERSTAPADVAGGVPVASSSSSSSKRRRVLVSVERISVAQSLWQLLTGSAAAQAVIGKPVIDCTLAPSGEPRLLAVLQAVGAAPRAHAMPNKEQQQQQPGSRTGGGSSGGSGGGSAGGDASKPEQQGQQAGGLMAAATPAAAAAAAAAKQRQGGKGESRGKDASDSDSDEEEAPTLAQAAMAAAAGQAAAQQRRADTSSKSSGGSGSSGSKSSGGSGGSKPADSSSSSVGSPGGTGGSSSGSGSGKSGSGGKLADSGKQQAASVASKPGKAARFGAAAAAAAGAAAAAAEAAEAAVRKEIARQRESSDSEDEEAPTLAQAARAARQHSGRGSSSSSGFKASPWSPAALLGFYRPPARKPQAQQAQQQAEAGGGGGGPDTRPSTTENNGASGSGGAGQGGGGSGGGGGKGQSWLPESLQHASSAVAVTGEVNAGKLQLCVSDGALLVPMEVRELLGKHLHLEVLQGAAAIEEAAADDQAASALGGGSSSSSSSGGGGGGGSNGRKKLKWVRHRPAVLLPWGTGMPQTPVQVRLDGELMNFRLEGWQTARGFVLLVRPIEASMQFTPALSRYLLTMAHPALGGTLGMKGNTTVHARLTPHDMLLPAKQATLRVEPLSVELGESPVLRQTVGVLGEVVGKLRVGGSVRAELSPIQATLGDDGQIRAERLDIRVQTGLGRWKQGLHLVSWGTANLQPPESLDATLCVPGDALKSLGLPELPDGAGLPLHISGTPTAPKIEIGRASRELALLVGQVATQQASALVKSKGGPQWLADKIGGIAGDTQARGVQMPPPLE